VGDSLGLAYKAKDTERRRHRLLRRAFHGGDGQDRESRKTVILPDRDAGCSLEQSCPGPQLEAFLKANAAKNYYVIAYINCSGHVKALSDCICTSGNAVKIVEAAPKDRPILFVPDQNLGSWVMEQTGRKMDLWKGACYVHVEFTRDSIQAIKDEHPTPKSSPTPNAPTPCACWPTKSAARKKWSATAATAPPAPSSSSPKAACCTAWSARCPERPSSPAPPATAPALTAVT
jgi:quinolinate synthetase A subunit